MKSTWKEQQREVTREEIKSIASRQAAQGGVASLSLSAIAREMGLTTPALYRYFPGRDELMAALASDAYASFIAALETARDAAAPEDQAGRLRSLCRSYHAWALEHPQQYSLIFSSQPAPDQLDPAVGLLADRSFIILLEIIQSAEQAGRLAPPQLPIPQGLARQLEMVRHPAGNSCTTWALYLATLAWSFIHGITSLPAEFTPAEVPLAALAELETDTDTEPTGD